MDVKLKQTNTTEASALLGHSDIVALLGLAVMMQAGIARDQPGTAVTVTLVPVDGSDEFQAQVDVVVDHNAKPVDTSPVADAAPVTAPAAAPPPIVATGIGIATV